MIHITSASNEKYAPGLILAIASSLYHLDPGADVTIHILNSSISNKSINKIKKICDILHPKTRLEIIDFTDSIFHGANLGPGNSYLTYARLVLARIVNCKKTIYLDCDVVVTTDLKEMWDLDMQNKIFIAAPNYPLTRLGDDCPFEISPSEKEYNYINAGVMLLDLDKIRERDLELQMLELAKSGQCKYHDQTIINYVFRNDIKIIPEKWNWQDENVIRDQNVINGVLHYSMKRKPWLYYNSTLKDRIWHFYYNNLVGNYLFFSLTNYNWIDSLVEIKKYYTRRYYLLRKFYLFYLSLKKSGSGDMITYYALSDGLIHDNFIFKKLKRSFK